MNGRCTGGVWLDLSHLPGDTVLARLPQLHRTLLELQMLDITRDPIEVAPTAQYAMGGVWVRPEDHGVARRVSMAGGDGLDLALVSLSSPLGIEDMAPEVAVPLPRTSAATMSVQAAKQTFAKENFMESPEGVGISSTCRGLLLLARV